MLLFLGEYWGVQVLLLPPAAGRPLHLLSTPTPLHERLHTPTPLLALLVMLPQVAVSGKDFCVWQKPSTA